MAILFTIFANLQQLVSRYVLTDYSSSPFTLGIFSMPLVYVIILGAIALIAYFCWQSYRQDVHEEKLQKDAVKDDKAHSSYNLAWVNKLVNWVYMTSPPGLPEAMQRWMEDVNLNLAKSEHPIKILLYDVRENSMPPWIGNIGPIQKRESHIELPVFLHIEKDDLAFTVSVQEENKGKVIASTYNVVVTQFQCWFTLYLSLVDGKGFLAKVAAQPQSDNQVKFRLDLLSDQKISTTVPEVVIDIIRKGLIGTPIYVNISNWGPVVPASKSKKSVRSAKREKNSSPQSNETSPNDGKSGALRRRHKDKKNRNTVDEDDSVRKSNTMPTGTTNVISERLKLEEAQGLSGSLGSLVGIKRTPSGRGPAKPIRSREKRIVLKVIDTSGLPKEGSLFCRGILDRPQQKSQTQPTKPGSIPAWPDEELTFDLSSRSSEVKLVFYRDDDTGNSEGSAVASAILYLEQIATDKSSRLVLRLRTANKENAQVTLQLDFTENPVDPTSQKFSSPRRSLDLSYMSDQVQQKESAASLLSTPSSYSTENMSTVNKTEAPVTIVKTVTTKKLTKNTTVTSTSNARRAAVESDTATVEGTVVDTAVKDLSHQSELAKQSPDANMKIRKGKVIITAIAKTNLDEDLGEDVAAATDNLVREAVQRLGSFHSVAESETPRSRAISDDGAGTNGVQGISNADEAVQLKGSGKTRRSRSQRPKSLATGVKASDLPRKQSEDPEWPKVRRSRSLIFGRGKKKLHKTGSANELDKQIISKEETGFDDDSMLSVPENDLQKQKKKKSKSISKLISKLGRKPSQRKSKLQPDPVDEDSISDTLPSPAPYSASPYVATPDSSGRPASFAGSSSSTPSSLQPDSSFQNSSTPEGSGLKRNKSLRKRLFGGKRKTNKN